MTHKIPVPVEMDMLAHDDSSVLVRLGPNLAQAFKARQIFRTETEARVSVLNDLHFPTKASKYWQSVREQCVMLEQLALLSFEFRRNELALERAQEAAAAATTGRVRTSSQIDIDECLFRRANMRTVAADRVREIVMWEKLKDENNDGSFNIDDVNEHQLVSYTVQFVQRALLLDKARITGGELDNLMGQLSTALSRADSVGALDKVLAELPAEGASLVRKQLPNGEQANPG